MPQTFDTIIVGLGAMGSAAAYHLAKAGQRVLGLDRFHPPHALGSSHGQTRIIREAYFEHPLYVPLVQRAYELWLELERHAREPLLMLTGGVMIGPPGGVVFEGARRSAEAHGLAHEILRASEVRRRFPPLNPDDSMMAVWEPRAGILFPEICVQTHLQRASKHGATLCFDEPVERWQPEGDGVRVFTAKETYSARHLVLSAGAWIEELVPGLNLPLQVERQVLFWFRAKAEAHTFDPRCFPVHLWEAGLDRFFYGFPDLGSGIKVARHHDGEIATPDDVCRTVDEAETEAMRNILERFIPNAAGPLMDATVCVYTNTPDHHFLIDAHPAHPQVILASPCSGHGFKFSSAVGEVLRDLVMGHSPRFDLSLFKYRWGA